MQLAMIGLGRMGGNMVERLLDGGHEVVAFDRDREALRRVSGRGATAAGDLGDLVRRLTPPRVTWVMVPAGDAVDTVIAALLPALAPGDIVIDGGNSNFRDSMRRSALLAQNGIDLVDCGTSGGIWGRAEGYCLMIGGSEQAVAHCEPIFQTLAPRDGYAHLGPSGAGHYVKMIHNGIEYGMLQAYAEGYELLHASADFELDLRRVAELWNHGSVIRSWINELAARTFASDAELTSIRGYVADSGEGRWTVQEAIELAVPAPVITLSLLMRFRSRQPDSFGARVIAALRREFGGHEVQASGEPGSGAAETNPP